MISGSGSPRDGSQRLVHHVGQPAVHPFDDVGVGVERDVYARVAQKLLDVLGMLNCHEEYRSAGVPEIVQPDIGQPRSLKKRLEVAAQQVRPAHRGARRGREHESVILPERACLEPLLVLARDGF
jgi:hypothetical protein